ncbi:MAG: hypothetical protein ACI8Q1_000999 [Parvicella sp.]|jgi:uncharacterized protein (TIGR00369 family)
MQTVESLYQLYNNLDKSMGFNLKVNGPGDIEYTVVLNESHLSSPGVGHGAVTAALMDAVLGTTALSAVYGAGNLVSTVEFKLNYFKPTLLNDELIGTGQIEFQGNRLIATSGRIIKKGSGELVSKGMGTFNIYPMSKRGIEK